MKASHHQREFWSISEINMTTTTLLIDKSATKIHQSASVNITLILKKYPSHEQKSQKMYTATLAKPSTLRSLKLHNPSQKVAKLEK